MPKSAIAAAATTLMQCFFTEHPLKLDSIFLYVVYLLKYFFKILNKTFKLQSTYKATI